MASTSKLSKSQRRRRNRRAKHAAARLLEQKIGTIPAHIISAFDGVPGNIVPVAIDQLMPEERAPSYLVDYGEEVPTFKDDLLIGMRSQLAASRQSTRDEYIADLKFRYRDLWGKRGAAKIIWSLERERGSETTVRTIQRYFKLSL